MIELIFVIVILGILASIAIPKLTATRTDALVTAELTNADQTKSNIINEYLSNGKNILPLNTDCFSFVVSNKILSVSKSVNNGATYCNYVYDINLSNNILISKTLGGYKVKF